MADHEAPNTGRLKLNNTVYDLAKEATTLWLPALATLYFALAHLWGLPKPDEVVATITAIVTFLGIVLKISTASYNNGKTGSQN
jgi:uncharacterized membrane protein